MIGVLSATVANPFVGLLPNTSSLNGSTVALSQLLLPYPEFPSGSGVDMQNAPSGESYFNSLNVRPQKRFTHGITLIQNFSYNAMVERINRLNDSDPSLEKRVSGDSRPLRETLAMTWDVPVGRNHHWNPPSHILNVGFWAGGP